MASVEMCSLHIGTYPVGKSKPRPLTEWDVSVFLTGALAPKKEEKRKKEVKGQCCCHSGNSCHSEADRIAPMHTVSQKMYWIIFMCYRWFANKGTKEYFFLGGGGYSVNEDDNSQKYTWS